MNLMCIWSFTSLTSSSHLKTNIQFLQYINLKFQNITNKLPRRRTEIIFSENFNQQLNIIQRFNIIIYIRMNNNKNKHFVLAIAISQFILLIIYAAFVDPQIQRANNMSQNLILVIIATLGFLYINHHKRENYANVIGAWLIITILSLQITFLCSYFWTLVHTRKIGFPSYGSISVYQACNSIIMLIIAYSNLKGFIGFMQVYNLTIIGIIGYTCNQMIITLSLKGLDSAGGIKIFLFGTLYGLTVRMISIPIRSFNKNNKTTAVTKNMSIYGLLYSIIFFPLFFQNYSVSYMNVLMTILSSLITSSLSHIIKVKKISFQILFECSIASSVMISTSADIIQNLAQPMIIGALTGICYTLWNRDLKAILKTFKIPDPSMNLKLFGIPGFLSGILAAINIASYQSSKTNKIGINFPYPNTILLHPIKYGGIEIGILVITVIMSIVFGLCTGILIKYTSNSNQLDDGDLIWNEQQQQTRSEDGQQRLLMNEQIDDDKQEKYANEIKFEPPVLEQKQKQNYKENQNETDDFKIYQVK